MNDRIRELASQCWDRRLDGMHFDQEKFAELIVKECVHVALKDALPDWGNQASEANAQCVKIASDLKKHFGVEQ